MSEELNMLSPTEQMLFTAIFVMCFAVAAHTVYRRIRVILSGQAIHRPQSTAGLLWQRLWNVLIFVPGQWSNIRNIRINDTAGLTHLFLFWGFIGFAVYFLMFETLHEGFGLFGQLRQAVAAQWFTHALDVLLGLLVLALFAATLRRALLKPARLGPQFEVVPMALLALAAALLAFTYFALQGLRQNLGVTQAGPISKAFSALFLGLEQSMQVALYHDLWWTQTVLVLLVMVYIPFSRHQHPIFAPLNILLLQERSHGVLKVIDISDVTDANQGRFGAKYVEDLNQKDLLDLYSCTQCGRCQDVCPAADTGKPLSPKAVINDLMHHVDEQANLLPFWERGTGTATLVDAIGRDALWSCTTCQACNEICPVGVEPMQKILEVRRDQVMNDGEVPPELLKTYRDLETAGDPWGYGPDKRTMWAQGLDIPVLGELASEPDKLQIDLLFWVGCTGAFDDQYRKIVRSFARVLQRAGVKFAILGAEERCSGDTARRTGNEWLFQHLANKNVRNFIKYGIRRVVTTCPHCFNTLKNEYTEFGLNLEVIHHTQLLASLMKSGELTVARPFTKTVTYHDACYLARYNDIILDPREILAGLGADIAEPPRNQKSSRCCGAGGGMMLLNESGTRINEDRASELVGCQPDTIVTACPFCHTMVESGVKAVDSEGNIHIADIVQLVEQAVAAKSSEERCR